MKFNKGQFVIILKGAKAAPHGGVGKIVDRNPDDKAYLVGEDYEKSYWFHEHELKLANLEPDKKTPVILYCALSAVVSAGITWLSFL